MAIGSLEPDSASSVEFSFWRMFCVPSTENTAAASVEPTIAPNKKPSSQVTPKIYLASTPVKTVVMRTPKVANETEGRTTRLTSFHLVCTPPSKRIMISANIPNPCVKRALSK